MPHYAVIGDNRPVVSYRSVRMCDGSTRLVPCSPNRSLIVPNNPEAEDHYHEQVELWGLEPVLNMLVTLAKLGHKCANHMADKLIDHYG